MEKKMVKAGVVLVLVAMLAGCGGGVDWFPAPEQSAAGVSPKTEEAAGAFIGEARNVVTREWFASTATGVFRMYTSTRFSAGEPLALRTTRSSGAVIYRDLKGSTGAFEVKL